MKLEESVEQSDSPFTKKILLPAALFASFLAAQELRAQEFDSPAKKQAAEEKTEKKEEKPRTDFISGYLQGEARTSNRENEFIGKGKLTLDPGHDWRLSAYATSEWHNFDNEDAKDLDVHSSEFDFAVGKYLTTSKKFDLYTELRIGKGMANLEEAIDLDADYFKFGGKLGVASRENGTRFELGIYQSTGDVDYELLSGFKGEGDFDRFFAGAELTQRLLGHGSKPAATRGEFDVRDLGDEFKTSLHLSLKGFYSRTEYADIQDARSHGIEFALPYVMNFRELMTDNLGNKYIEGHMWEFKPYLQWENGQSESDRSVRETDSDRFRIGIDVKFKPTKWLAIKAGVGYEWYRLDIDDPVRGNDRRNYDGIVAGVGISADW